MRRHAVSFHAAEWKEIQRKSSVQHQQLSIKSCFSSQVPYGVASSRRTQLNEQIVRIIVEDLEPLSIVEHKGFQGFCALIDPKYTLTTRKTLREKLIPEAYEKQLKQLQEELNKAKYVGITTDLWTSSSTESFNALIAHYLDVENGKLCSKILDCSLFEGRHKGEALETEIKRVATLFKIDKKLAAGVSDNAANIKKALKDLGIRSIPCFAHSLNLVVHDVLKTSNEIQHIRNKVAVTVSLTHRSVNAKKSLMQCQVAVGLPGQKSLIQDVPTRWNSLFLMLERFIELKDPLTLFFVQERSKNALTSEEWITVEELVSVLRPMYDATVEISSEKLTTMSKVIPLTNQLMCFYSEGETSGFVGQIKKEIENSLKARFHWAEGFLNYAVATILDPRFKQWAFTTSTAVTQAYSLAKHEALAQITEMQNISTEGTLEEHEPEKKKVSRSDC